MSKQTVRLIPLAFAALLTAALLFLMMAGAPSASAQAVPPLQPPTAGPNSFVTFLPETRIATSGAHLGPELNLMQFDTAELQYVIDQGAISNTTTLALQYSNNGVTWSSTALVSGNTADASGWLTPSITGRLQRLSVTVANTQPVTITVQAVVEP